MSFKPGKDLMPVDSSDEKDVAIDNDVSLADTWKAMIELPKTKARSVGVSNFSIDHVRLFTGCKSSS